MNIDAFYTALIILVAAAVTFGTRLLAFVIFGGRKGGEPPKWVTYLGQVLPPAVIALLIVYCLRSVSVTEYSWGLPELIAGAATVGIHLWKRSMLLSIAAGTVIYMLLVQFVFV